MPIALVTGATRGLGRAVAGRLSEAGVTVIVAGRDLEQAEAVAFELNDAGAVRLDVTDAGSARAAADAVRARHGRLDVLVNNAGILPEATAASAEALDTELFRQTLDTNLIGAVAVTEALLPLLRESAAGRIVNVSSTVGSMGDQSDPESPFYELVVPAYQASKAALNSVTVSLAKRLADTPVKVNAVCPGFVQTELTPVNREQAPLTAEEAARTVARYALLGDDGPSGGFFDDAGPVAW